jgi:hypothetical protein
MSDAVFQLLYVSGASRPVTRDDITQILAASRRNNAALDVTGCLLYADQTFIQVLEGEKATVEKLAARIRQDMRHRNFMVLVEQMAPERAFGDWQMGFKELDMTEATDGSVFAMSRSALAERTAGDKSGMMLDLILAFSNQPALAKAS